MFYFSYFSYWPVGIVPRPLQFPSVLKILVVFVVQASMFSRSGLSFYICGILHRAMCICDSASNSGRHKICNFGLCVSLLTLSRFVRYFLFYVSALLWRLFPDLIKELPVWCFFCFFGCMCFVVFVALLTVHLIFFLSTVCPVISCRWLMLWFWI